MSDDEHDYAQGSGILTMILKRSGESVLAMMQHHDTWKDTESDDDYYSRAYKQV